MSGTSMSLTLHADSAVTPVKTLSCHLLKVRLSFWGEEGGQDLGVEGKQCGGCDAAHSWFESPRCCTERESKVTKD